MFAIAWEWVWCLSLICHKVCHVKHAFHVSLTKLHQVSLSDIVGYHPCPGAEGTIVRNLWSENCTWNLRFENLWLLVRRHWYVTKGVAKMQLQKYKSSNRRSIRGDAIGGATLFAIPIAILIYKIEKATKTRRSEQKRGGTTITNNHFQEWFSQIIPVKLSTFQCVLASLGGLPIGHMD